MIKDRDEFENINIEGVEITTLYKDKDKLVYHKPSGTYYNECGVSFYSKEGVKIVVSGYKGTQIKRIYKDDGSLSHIEILSYP
mgnify:CR=1 FL=1